jgi:hypothetical protein
VTVLADIQLVGVNAESATKLLYSLVLVAALIVLRWSAHQVVRVLLRGRSHISGGSGPGRASTSRARFSSRSA